MKRLGKKVRNGGNTRDHSPTDSAHDSTGDKSGSTADGLADGDFAFQEVARAGADSSADQATQVAVPREFADGHAQIRGGTY